MKKVFAVLLVAVMCFGLFACGGKQETPAPQQTTQQPAATAPATTPAKTDTAQTPSGPEYDEVTFQLSHVNVVDHGCHLAYLRWSELLQEKSGGKVKIDVYPAGQLYNQEDGNDACTLGDLDMTQADISGLTAKVPSANVLCLPMFYTSYDSAAKVFFGPVGEAVNKDIEKAYNYHVMGWIWNGFRVMCTNDPIDELADCKGYKLRVPPIDLYMNTFVPMGFSPVQTPWGEAYTAMQSGLADGVETTVEAVYTQGFGTLGGNVTTTNHILSVIGPVVNLDKWNSLSPDTQQLLTETWATAQKECNDAHISKEEGYLQAMKEEGVDVRAWKDPQELIDLFAPQWEETAKKGGFEDLFKEAYDTIK